MPATIVMGGHGAHFAFTEFSGPNGTGSVVAPIGTIQFATSDPSVGLVDASGNVTVAGVGTCNIVGTDAGNGLSASDVLTVQAAAVAAVSATGVLTANP
jgi:hypothetical protein